MAKRVPVYADGRIAGYAQVDDDVYAWAAARRWHLSDGLARHKFRIAGGGTGSVYLHKHVLGQTKRLGARGLWANGDKLDCRRENLLTDFASGVPAGSTYRIPLAANGEECWAIVDAVSYASLANSQWHRNKSGYVAATVDGRKVLMHRLLLGLSPGDGLEGDHINRDKLDNRLANLRVATGAQNSQNQPLRPGAKSRYRNVAWCQGKWQVVITLGARRHYLGRYADEDEAGAVAAAWRREHMPFATD